MANSGAELVNIEGGLSRVRGNQKLYTRMLGLFLAGGEYADFESAVAANDVQKAADVMHAIKGVSGNLNLDALFEISTELMNTLRGGTMDLERIDVYREVLKDTIAAVEKTIADMAQ